MPRAHDRPIASEAGAPGPALPPPFVPQRPPASPAPAESFADASMTTPADLDDFLFDDVAVGEAEPAFARWEFDTPAEAPQAESTEETDDDQIGAEVVTDAAWTWRPEQADDESAPTDAAQAAEAALADPFGGPSEDGVAEPAMEEEEAPSWLSWLDNAPDDDVSTDDVSADDAPSAAGGPDFEDAFAAPIVGLFEEAAAPPEPEAVGEPEPEAVGEPEPLGLGTTVWPPASEPAEIEIEAGWIDAIPSAAVAEEPWDSSILHAAEVDLDAADAAQPAAWDGAAEDIDADTDVEALAVLGAAGSPAPDAAGGASAGPERAAEGPDDAAPAPQPLLAVAERLERIAQTLREQSPAELLGRGSADPLELLIVGYALGYAQADARRGAAGAE